jgi:hypothetical protein
MSPVTLLSCFQKINSIVYGNFQTYGSLHWLIFQDRSGNISCIQNFYSLPPFMHLSFPKWSYPPLYRKLSQFSLMLLDVVLLPSTPKITTRLNILFLPPLKGRRFMLLSRSSGTFHSNLSTCAVAVTMWKVFYAALKLLISVILVVKSCLIFSFSCVVWCEPTSIPVL